MDRCVRPMCLGLALLASACCAEEPRASLPVVPIKSACPALMAPASRAGLDVRAGRRHSEAQTIFVTNLGDAPKEVRINQIARVEGPCAGDWARQTQLDYLDAATCEPPAPVTLAPKQFERIEIGAQRVRADWSCTKMGVAVWLEADDQRVCADAIAGVATADGAPD